MRRKIIFLLTFLFIISNLLIGENNTAPRFEKNTIKRMIEEQGKSVVNLQPGIYTEEYIKINHPVEIIGESPGSVFVHSQNYVQILTNSDLKLKNINFFIEGDNPLYKKGIAIYTKNGNVDINNCTFSGFGKALIAFSKENLNLSDSTFNFNRSGISVVFSNAIIENCFFSDNSFEAIILSNPHIILRNNRINNNGLGVLILPHKDLRSWDKDISLELNKFINNKTGISIFHLPFFKVYPSSDLGGGKESNGKNTFLKNLSDIKIYGNRKVSAKNNFFESNKRKDIMKKIILVNKGKIILFDGDEE